MQLLETILIALITVTDLGLLVLAVIDEERKRHDPPLH